MPEDSTSAHDPDFVDRAEELMQEILERSSQGQAVALERICAENPDLAPTMRSAFEAARRVGFLHSNDGTEEPDQGREPTRLSEIDDIVIDREIGLLEECLADALAHARRHVDPVILRNEFELPGLPAFRRLLFQKVLCKLVDRKPCYQRDKQDVGRQMHTEWASGSLPIEQLQASLTSPSGAAMCSEDLLRFQRCFAQLPPDYQHVIRRSRLEGRTHAENAEELGRKPGAVKVLLYRALIRLGLLMDAEARGLEV